MTAATALSYALVALAVCCCAFIVYVLWWDAVGRGRSFVFAAVASGFALWSAYLLVRGVLP